MTNFRSLPPFEPDDPNWSAEWFSRVDQVSITNPQQRIFPEQDTARVGANTPPPISLPSSTTTKTDPLPQITTPVYDTATTQSLLEALQSTMSTTTSRQPVVIPGTRKRVQPMPERHLHPHLRLIIVLVALLLFLLISLLTLSPLGGGQNGFHLINGVIEWAKTQQQSWSISAHDMLQQDQQNQNNTPAGAPLALPKSQYVAIARQDAINVGINPDYFVQQINVESGFNPNASSGAGAVGIAQFVPSTAASLGVDPWDPVSSLQGAARLMASYSQQYNGNYAMALAAYNAGAGTVNHAISVGGANWMNFLPFETRQYIFKIMGI